LVNEYYSRKIVKIFLNRLPNDIEIRIHENSPLGKSKNSNFERSNSKPLEIYWGFQIDISLRSILKKKPRFKFKLWRIKTKEHAKGANETIN